MTFMSEISKWVKFMKLYEQFGEKVRKLRKEKDISQEELAEKIKRDPRTVVAIETGKRNPTLNTIYKIAQALNVSLSELLRF